jgi:phasin family protein
MYAFTPAVTPAVRSHLDAQVTFFNEMSKSLARSFQNVCELNIDFGRSLLEEGSSTGHELLTTGDAAQAMSIAASRAQPAADKMRAYQQEITRVLADAQLELARVTEQHSQVTLRTARELADQVAQAATEETEKGIVKQQEIMKNLREPFQRNGVARGNSSVAPHGNLQSADGQGDTGLSA